MMIIDALLRSARAPTFMRLCAHEKVAPESGITPGLSGMPAGDDGIEITISSLTCSLMECHNRKTCPNPPPALHYVMSNDESRVCEGGKCSPETGSMHASPSMSASREAPTRKSCRYGISTIPGCSTAIPDCSSWLLSGSDAADAPISTIWPCNHHSSFVEAPGLSRGIRRMRAINQGLNEDCATLSCLHGCIPIPEVLATLLQILKHLLCFLDVVLKLRAACASELNARYKSYKLR